MGFVARVRAVRWVGSCVLPSEDLTGDERVAAGVCCPCYSAAALAAAVVGLAAAVALVAAAPLVMAWELGESIGRCFPMSDPPPDTGPARHDGGA